MLCAFGVERAAKRECLSDSSFCDLRMASCILPPLCRRAENTRSTPADEAHAASRYCTAWRSCIFASVGHLTPHERAQRMRAEAMEKVEANEK